MIAVGLWGTLLCSYALWMIPVTFPMMMVVGGMLSLIGVPVLRVELGIAISGAVLGATFQGEVKTPLAMSIILVGAFATFHDHADRTELSRDQNAMLYNLGFVISTGTLHAARIGMGTTHRST